MNSHTNSTNCNAWNWSSGTKTIEEIIREHPRLHSFLGMVSLIMFRIESMHVTSPSSDCGYAHWVAEWLPRKKHKTHQKWERALRFICTTRFDKKFAVYFLQTAESFFIFYSPVVVGISENFTDSDLWISFFQVISLISAECI